MNLRWLLALLVLGLMPSLRAGDDGGTTSPFDMGAGSRELALSGAALASADATTAIYWNPARLARAERFAVTGFYSQLYESDVAYQYAAAVFPTLDFGSIGIGVFRLGVNDIERRDENNLATGSFSDSRLALYVAYARQWSDYDVGLSATFEHQSLDSYSATSSPGLTLSVGRRFGTPLAWLPQWDIYLIGRNVSSASIQLADQEYSYPITAALGISALVLPTQSRQHVAHVNISLRKSELIDPRLAVGIEYTFANLLQVRGGLTGTDAAIGGGVTYRSFSFDYALTNRDLGSLHLFTLTTTFGPTISERLANRAAEREREFNNLMSERLTAQNRRTVERLQAESDDLRENGDLVAAVDRLDRALFVARGSGLDTVALAESLHRVKQDLEYVNSTLRQEALLDSARTELDHGNYLAARYYASLVLTESPTSESAKQIESQANSAINESNLREDLIATRLYTVDSLLSFGMLQQARPIVRSLVKYAPDNPLVKSARTRVEFEYWRQAATEALADRQFAAAQAAADSVAAILPGHQWSRYFDNRLKAEQHRAQQPAPVVAPAPTSIQLSPELRREVEQLYSDGRRAFQAGQLAEAIDRWQRVEQLAPDFESVREYLVNAYKFVGVELYGQNKLQEAVATWRQAAALDPNNPEIAGYIKRTETEINKLKELSYEQE